MNRKQRRASAKLVQTSGTAGGMAVAELLGTGVDHLQAGRLADAEGCYRQVLALQPDNADALHLLGIVALRVGRNDVAADLIARAAKRDSRNPMFAASLGTALMRLGRLEEAIACYDKALALKPDYAEACNNRGNALQMLRRYDEALASYDRALVARPDHAETLNNRGVTLYELRRFEDAVVDYQAAIAARPDYAEAFFNLGNALQKLNRFDAALASYDKTLALRPEYAEGHNSRGLALKEMRQIEQASASYRKAIAIKPDYPEAHWNEAILQLLTGDFDHGWRGREWRWKSSALGLRQRDFSQPLWLGSESIEGKTILLHSDEGLGDAIHFCRYAPLVAARGAQVVVEVERPLQPLMSDVSGVSISVARGEPLPGFDLHCPLSSLPLAFGTRLETIPSTTPYLRAPDSSHPWNARLGTKDGPRIGLVWAGNPQHKNDHNRSIALGELSPLFDVAATFVSLQKDVRAADQAVLDRIGLVDLGPELRSFADTAAVISQLDLVISVDTSVAHLAGALGRPVWVLLPFVPDWRWLLDRDDSPWYPTARLYRQNETRKWDDVVVRLREALQDLMA